MREKISFRIQLRCEDYKRTLLCFPVHLSKEKYHSCTTVDNGNTPCCATTSNYDKDKKWGNCEKITEPTNPKGTTTAVKTTSGQSCVFPFTYKGKVYNSCTTVHNGNRLWCSTTSIYHGKWGNCVITQGKTTAVKTTSGQSCVFPFTYKGKVYNSCTTAHWHRLWCSTTSIYRGKCGNCAITQGDSPFFGRFGRTVTSFDFENDNGQVKGGLFTADQNLNGHTTKYTRQNANGGRSGYECPEERDYYPYWHPTDWNDIAVLTDDDARCKYYRKESFNVKPKEECLQYYNSKSDGFRHDSIFNNKVDCEKNNGFWVSFSNYLEEYSQCKTEQQCTAESNDKRRLIWAIPYRSEDIDNLKITGDNVESLKRCLVALDPPECKKAPSSRTNHLGNGRNLVPLRYSWVIPHFPSGDAQRCVFRIRYNISTGDYPPFNTFADKNNDPDNGVKSPVTNNPEVKVGDDQLQLQLAINTAQFGRTFQDRSHLFKLVPRPNTVSDNDVIYNLNVRGKRGNIVQAFPAVEYDFMPKRLEISSANLVHIQWTGSNTNPNNFAGQGTAGTDRHNIVEMEEPSVNYPLTSGKQLTMFTNAEIVWSSDSATKTKRDLVLSMGSSGYYNSVSQKAHKAALDDELNNAPASYRGMLLKFAAGKYYYMCTRNNNFSNRNQKGRLVVH